MASIWQLVCGHQLAGGELCCQSWTCANDEGEGYYSGLAALAHEAPGFVKSGSATS